MSSRNPTDTLENQALYEDYYAKPWWWFRWRYDTQVKRKTALELLAKLDGKWCGKRVFELGFGSGDLLLSFPNTCELYGAEMSSSAVAVATNRMAERKYKNFRFFKVQGDGPLPLGDEFVDLVIVSHVLEHVNDDVSCVRELYRILKTGGFLAVLVPINERYMDPNHLRQFTFDSCRNLCERNGFRFLHGFENELLFCIVEKLYFDHRNKEWKGIKNVLRIIFNLLAAPLPFRIYRLIDLIISYNAKIKPRQAALLFKKA